MSKEIMQKMFNSGLHFGYAISSSHPKMKQFVFTAKNKVEIFDLEKTKDRMDAAKKFVKELGAAGKKIIFVGTKAEAKSLTEKYALGLGMPFVSERWLGGILTNFSEIKKRLDGLADLDGQTKKPEFAVLKKKEKARIVDSIEKAKKYFGGLAKLDKLPAALIITDGKHEKNAVDEALKIGMPIVALLNTDCNPEGINYPVPGNDATVASIEYFLSEISDAYKEGMKEGVKIKEKTEEDSKKKEKEKSG